MVQKNYRTFELGKYIVADPFICHGSPTFKGTRKLVRDAIEAFTLGLTIDELAEEAEVSREAIIEALQLASAAVNEYYSAPDPDNEKDGVMNMRELIGIKKIFVFIALCFLNLTVWVNGSETQDVNVNLIKKLGIGTILSVAWSPDSKLLAAGTNAGVYLLNPLEERRITDSGIVSSVTFSPDGSLIASGGLYGVGDECKSKIKLWKVSDGKCIATLEVHRDCVNSVAFSPDGSVIASGGLKVGGNTDESKGEIRLWSVKDGKCIANLEEHEGLVYSVSFSPDGSIIASGSEDNTIKLWSVRDGVCIATLKGHWSLVSSVSFSPDGLMIASGGGDEYKSEIKLWWISNGQCIATLEGHQSFIPSVSFSPDGSMIASGSNDDTIKLWSVSSGQCIATLEGHEANVYSVSFSPDGSLIASGSADGIGIWKVEKSATKVRAKDLVKLEKKLKAGDALTYIVTSKAQLLTMQRGMQKTEVKGEALYSRIVTEVDEDGVVTGGDLIVTKPLQMSFNGEYKILEDYLHKLHTYNPYSKLQFWLQNCLVSWKQYPNGCEVSVVNPLLLVRQQTWGILPAKPVKVGDSWTVENRFTFDPLTLTLVGFERVKGFDCAKIKSTVNSENSTSGEEFTAFFALNEGLFVKMEYTMNIDTKQLMSPLETDMEEFTPLLGWNMHMEIQVDLSKRGRLKGRKLNQTRKELAIIEEGIELMAQNPYEAKAVFEKFLVDYPKSRWRKGVEGLLALIDVLTFDPMNFNDENR